MARQQLRETGERLSALETTCASIGALPEPEAEAARQALADARYAFTQSRACVIRELEVVSLRNAEAARAREILRESHLYPSAESAFAVVRLTEALVEAQTESAPPSAPRSPDGLPKKLQDAMRLRGDNKKSAAGAIVVSTKTLDRLLNGDPTKSVKQQAAWRYINSTGRSS